MILSFFEIWLHCIRLHTSTNKTLIVKNYCINIDRNLVSYGHLYYCQQYDKNLRKYALEGTSVGHVIPEWIFRVHLHMFQTLITSKREVSIEPRISRRRHEQLPEGKFWIVGHLKSQENALCRTFFYFQIIPRKLNFALSSRELSCISLSHITNIRTDCLKGHVLESKLQR